MIGVYVENLFIFESSPTLLGFLKCTSLYNEVSEIASKPNCQVWKNKYLIIFYLYHCNCLKNIINFFVPICTWIFMGLHFKIVWVPQEVSRATP